MSQLDVPEIEELLGAYALDAVDPDERAAVEAHLAECPRCRAELADHLEVAALIGSAGSPAPEGLWSRIADSLEAEPPALRLAIAESAEVIDLERHRRARLRRYMIGAVAAAVVVIAGLGVVVLRQEQRIDQLQPDELAGDLPGAAGEALADPVNTRTVLSQPDGSGAMGATAVVTPAGAGYLVTSNLPALPDDRTYQLWGVVGADAISLGVLGSNPSVTAFHVDSGTPISAFAITEEASGGVVSSQNDPVLLGTA